MCISNKSLGDADAGGPGTALGEPAVGHDDYRGGSRAEAVEVRVLEGHRGVWLREFGCYKGRYWGGRSFTG